MVKDYTSDLQDKVIHVHVVSLGCPKNLVDSESMCGILTAEGYHLTEDPAEAQVIVINTCGFIESAKKEAIDKILEMADYKKGDTPDGCSCDFLIVTGCLAQRYTADIAGSMPEVDAILGISEYGSIAQTIRDLYDQQDTEQTDRPALTEPVIRTSLSLDLQYLDGSRIPSTQGYAYLKIAEGCSNCCSFCAIPGIRGRFRSRLLEELVSEARGLAEAGFYEIVLIAQDTTKYGLDLYGERKLPELMHAVSQIKGIRKVRILYCYSDGITPELIREMRDNPIIAKYIDMPIQHASDAVLRRMNRKDTAQSIEQTIRTLREEIPGITIRTTLMVGFPGETQEDFDTLYSFTERMRFELLGCFVFSPEEGTAAYAMKPRVPAKVARDRYRRIMELQQRISFQKNMDNIGKKIRITVEAIAEDGIFYLGRGDAQAPEIDPPVYAAASEEPLRIGQEYEVRIVNSSDYEQIGVIVS